jgi:hypothetical protein
VVRNGFFQTTPGSRAKPEFILGQKSAWGSAVQWKTDWPGVLRSPFGDLYPA